MLQKNDGKMEGMEACSSSVRPGDILSNAYHGILNGKSRVFDKKHSLTTQDEFCKFDLKVMWQINQNAQCHVIPSQHHTMVTG